MGRTAHIGEERVAQIRRWAEELGFSAVGFSKAQRLETEEPRLAAWLAEERHGSMGYLERNFDKRLDPRLAASGHEDGHQPPLQPLHGRPPGGPEAPNFDVCLRRGLPFRGQMEAQGAAQVDAPGLGRHRRSGLCRFGADPGARVGCQVGSRLDRQARAAAQQGGREPFLLGEILVDLDLPPDGPVTDHCGDCTRCIDVCPTQAIIRPQVVDGSRCISYFTIELRDALPEPMAGQFDDWMFGCDLCQEVCPWNRHATPHKSRRSRRIAPDDPP